MQVEMKPETIARRAAARSRNRTEAKAERIRRLRDLIARDGAHSVWVDLLTVELETA